MKKVHILSDQVISKIAAGEVIHRPASAVKEIIENSLDAGSTSIELNLKQSGKSLIHLKDNGSGIYRDDLERIFARHATSKIQTIDDLEKINSLGFRGEALYSIGAIADVILRSKPEDQDAGWEIHFRGQEKISITPCPMPNGTEIQIQELFFNTPARRKFLKSNTTETQQILNTFIPYTILYPQCRFKLNHSKKNIFDLSPVDSILQRASAALNLNQSDLIQADKEFPQDKISIQLILGNINIQRARKDMQFIFINNRPVQNHNISFHINQIYRAIMPDKTHPCFALYINLPPQNLDVNIHPAKREVKIKNDYYLISLLRSLCESALISQGPAKRLDSFTSLDSEKTYKLDSYPRSFSSPKINQPQQQYNFTSQREPSSQQALFAEPKQDTLRNRLKNARYIGYFMKKYLFFEAKTTLLIIDQHAACERVTYELFKQQLDTDRLEVQNLLEPIIISLSAQEMVVWEILKDKIENIGFTTTLWDKESIALHNHPHLITNPQQAIRNLLCAEERSHFDNNILAQRACRNSIMTGYKMPAEQADYLRKQLMQCKEPFACPHGRPTVIEIQEHILKKTFLR